MKNLIIQSTKSTPEINFDIETNRLKIIGQSYPENPFEFYEPVLKWVDEYMIQASGAIEIEIRFSLPYINTSSSKCIMMLLDKLESAHEDGKKININWYYDEENESELECAEEFKEDFSLPFYITPIKNNI